MATAAELAVLFTADTKGLDRGMKESQGLVGGLISKLGGIGLAGMGISTIVSGAKAIAAPMREAIAGAEALGDAQARNALVFGASADGVADWAGEVANGLGLTKTAFLAAASAQGDLLTSMGIGQEKAADMAATLTELAPKLAAYAGVGADKAMDALTKGVTGATRGLKELGIIIPEIPKGMNDASKAAFIYAEILKQGADANAAWAGNAGDIEVSGARIAATFSDIKTRLAEGLLPLFAPLAAGFANVFEGALPLVTGLADKITSYLVPAVGILQGIFTGDWAGGGNQALEDLREKAGPLADVVLHVGYAVSDVKDALMALAGGDWQGAWDALGNGVYSAIEGFGKLTGIDITGIIDSLFGGDRDTGDGLWSELGGKIVELKDFLVGLKDKAVEVWSGVLSAYEAAKPGILTATQTIIEKAGLLRDGLVVLWGKAKEAWSGIQKAVDDARPGIESAIDTVKSKADDLKKGWDDLVSRAQEAWNRIPELVKAAQPLIDDAMSGIKAASADLVEVWKMLGPALTGVVNYLKEVWGRLSAWFEFHSEEIKLIFTGLWLAVSGIFQVGWNLIMGILKPFLALLAGDTKKAKEDFLKHFDGMIDGVKRILGGLGGIIGGILATVARDMGGKAAEIGTNIVNGLKNAIFGGKDEVAKASAALSSAAINASTKTFGVASPSKVFEEIGSFLVDGLVLGISKQTVKAFEAAKTLSESVAGTVRGMIDAFSALNSSEALQSTDGLADRFRAMLVALRPLRDALQEIGIEMQSGGKSAPGERARSGMLYQDIEKAAKGIKPILESVRGVVDALGSIGGTETRGVGGRIESIITAVIPSPEVVQAAIARARQFFDVARGLMAEIRDPAQFHGIELFAGVVGSMAGAFKAVAEVKIDSLSRLAAGTLETAAANIRTIVAGFWGMLSAFRDMESANPGSGKDLAESAHKWADVVNTLVGVFRSILDASKDLKGVSAITAELAKQAQDSVRLAVGAMWGLFDVWLKMEAGSPGSAKDVVEGARGWAETVESLVGVFRLGLDAGKDLKAVSTLTADALEIAKTNIDRVIALFSDLSENGLGRQLDAWLRTSREARATLTEGAKEFQGMLASLVGILNLADIGKIEASLDVSATRLTAVFSSLLTLATYTIRPLIEATRTVFARLKIDMVTLEKDMKEFGGLLGAVVSVIKASAVGRVQSDMDVSAKALESVLNSLLTVAVYSIRPIIEGAKKVFAQIKIEAASLEKDIKEFSGLLASTVGIIKSAVVGRIETDMDVSAKALESVLSSLLTVGVYTIRPIIEGAKRVFAQIKIEAADLEADLTEFAGLLGGIVGVISATAVGKIDASLDVSAKAVESVLNSLLTLGVYVIRPIVDSLKSKLSGLGVDAKSLADDFGMFGDFIGSIAGVLKSVAGLPAAQDIPELTAEIVDRMLVPVRLLAEAFATFAPEIDKATNEALASMGPAVDAVAKTLDVIETAILSPFFGAGRRARSSSSADLFKKRLIASIQEAVSAMVTALSGVSVPADLGSRLAPLKEAAEAIKAAFEALGSAKLPRDLPRIIAAAMQLAGALGMGGGGGGASGSPGATGGGSGGPTGAGSGGTLPIIQGGLQAIVDGWRGDVGCIEIIRTGVGLITDGWRGDVGCITKVREGIGAITDGWRGDVGCIGIIRDGLASVFTGASGAGADAAQKFAGEVINVWIQRGGEVGKAFGGAIREVWIQRGGTGPGPAGGGGMGVFGGGGGLGDMQLAAQSVTLTGTVMFPSVRAEVTVNTSPRIEINGRVIDAIATQVERLMAQRARMETI